MADKKTRSAKQREAPEVRATDAALRLAGLQGWADTTLADIAAEAELPLDQLYGLCRGKQEILDAFVRRIDEAVLAGTDADIGLEPVRDRLFDLLMRRIDALKPYKEGVRAIVRELPRDPAAMAMFGIGPMRRSYVWMLEGARIEPWGLLQPLQLQGFNAIYLYVLRAWLRDDSEDLGPTMAALDKALGRADTLVSFLRFGGRRRGRAGEVPADG